MLNRVVPVKAIIEGKKEEFVRGDMVSPNSRYGRKRKRSEKVVQHGTLRDDPGTIIGTWRLHSQMGFREWLMARGLDKDAADNAVAAAFFRTRTIIEDSKKHDDGAVFTTVTKVKWRPRRKRERVEYRLDGTTVLTMKSPLGDVEITAAVEDGSLVHRVVTPRGLETHLRELVDGRLVQTMTDSTGATCVLTYSRC